MPCTYVRVNYKTQIDLANADKSLVKEAILLMGFVKSAEMDQWGLLRVKLKDGTSLSVDIRETGLELDGINAYKVKEKLTQYYAAVVQAIQLKRQGFQNVNIGEVEDALKIMARK